MIKSTYRFGGEMIEVIVRGNELLFNDMNGMITTLEGLKLDKTGVLKEFPDLKDAKDWRKQAVERLKKHLRTMGTEIQKTNYVKDELIKFGYEPKMLQRAGHRPRKFQ